MEECLVCVTCKQEQAKGGQCTGAAPTAQQEHEQELAAHGTHFKSTKAGKVAKLDKARGQEFPKFPVAVPVAQTKKPQKLTQMVLKVSVYCAG